MSTIWPGTPVWPSSMASEISAPAATVRSSETQGETKIRPPAIGSSTPSGDSSSNAPPIRRAASAGPSARSALIPASGSKFAAVIQGTSSGRSVSHPTNSRCATRRVTPAARKWMTVWPSEL